MPDQKQLLDVRLSGRMTLGPHLLEFSQDVIAALTACRASAVLLDMSQVEAIDSAGLGELMILFTTAGQHDCRVCLVSPSAHIARILETTRLRAILRDFPDAESANAWLSS
jgi:anti-sigma B factor antagonist